MPKQTPIPDVDDMDAWGKPVWSAYPGQTICVSKNGAVRLEAGRKVIVRKNLATLIKEIRLPEPSR